MCAFGGSRYCELRSCARERGRRMRKRRSPSIAPPHRLAYAFERFLHNVTPTTQRSTYAFGLLNIVAKHSACTMIPAPSKSMILRLPPLLLHLAHRMPGGAGRAPASALATDSFAIGSGGLWPDRSRSIPPMFCMGGLRGGCGAGGCMGSRLYSVTGCIGLRRCSDGGCIGS